MLIMIHRNNNTKKKILIKIPIEVIILIVVIVFMVIVAVVDNLEIATVPVEVSKDKILVVNKTILSPSREDGPNIISLGPASPALPFTAPSEAPRLIIQPRPRAQLGSEGPQHPPNTTAIMQMLLTTVPTPAALDLLPWMIKRLLTPLTMHGRSHR